MCGQCCGMPLHCTRLLRTPCGQCLGKARVGHPVMAVDECGQKTARQLVFALGARLEACQTFAQAIFDALGSSRFRNAGRTVVRGCPNSALPPCRHNEPAIGSPASLARKITRFRGMLRERNPASTRGHCRNRRRSAGGNHAWQRGHPRWPRPHARCGKRCRLRAPWRTPRGCSCSKACRDAISRASSRGPVTGEQGTAHSHFG